MAENNLLKTFQCLLLITGYYRICITGMVTLSPTSVAPVCQVGDQLELTCTANGSFLRWIFTVGNEQGVLQEYQRNINSLDEPQQMTFIELNSTTFTSMRTSDQGILPLISTLVISSVSNNLNGTRVHCQDVETSITVSTTIQLLDNIMSPALMIVITSEEYNDSNVTVMLEWAEEEGVTYNVDVIPQIPITNIGGTNIQLILLYNTAHNVSVGAALPCGHEAHSHLRLFYANCGYQPLSADNSEPIVTYSGLPIEGATVNFICPTGQVLNGRNSSTCMRNGEWEPAPQELECINIFNCDPPSPPSRGYIDSYNHSAEGLTVNFVCQNSTTCICLDETKAAKNQVLHTAACTLDGSWEPNLEDFCSSQNFIPTDFIPSESSRDVNVITVTVASLVAVLLVSNAFLFITGCVCGHYLCQKCKKMANRDSQPRPSPDGEVDTQLNSMGADEEALGLELEKNVAYGHFQ